MNIENKLSEIELDWLFKKEILEKYLNEQNYIVYNESNCIMEIDKKFKIEEEEFLIDDNEDDGNKITMIYKKKEEKKIRILGKRLVENNKGNCKLLDRNLKYY